MTKHKPKEPDPFREWREWQDHMYDPGYFVGGRIHPIYRAVRPNGWGGVLLVTGVATTAFGFGLGHSGESGLFSLLFGILQIVAGAKMLSRPTEGRRPKKHQH